MYKLSFLCFI